VSNGFGKMTGTTQIQELGNLETPIVLTNTLSVPTAANALISYTINQKGNEQVQSVNPVVGETNDGWLNDIRGRHVNEKHVLQAIYGAESGMIKQGSVGAGTGTTAFGFKGGIGTASRQLSEKNGGYTVGVLVQTNFGGVLTIDGVPVGQELGTYYLDDIYSNQPQGSCMIVVATDAPLTSRNLERLAKRASFGIPRTGGIGSNGSGDYSIAFSTNPNVRIFDRSDSLGRQQTVLQNSSTTPLFMAAIEATEEAIINSLFAAKDTQGFSNHKVSALPVKRVIKIMQEHGRSVKKQ
jgi:D-aminopeptidase